MPDWQSIASAPKEQTAAIDRVALGPLILLRDSLGHEARGHWRLPVQGYDIHADRVVERTGAWWSDRFEPLDWVPNAWAVI